MTSPLSLLAPLAGVDPAAPAQPGAGDPAVFAAALIAALQLLQAAPAVEPRTPASTSADAETPDGEAPPADVQTDAAGAAASPVTKQTSEPDGELTTGSPALFRSGRDALATAGGKPEGAACGVAPEARHRRAASVDLISPETAAPVPIGSVRPSPLPEQGSPTLLADRSPARLIPQPGCGLADAVPDPGQPAPTEGCPGNIDIPATERGGSAHAVLEVAATRAGPFAPQRPTGRQVVRSAPSSHAADVPTVCGEGRGAREDPDRSVAPVVAPLSTPQTMAAPAAQLAAVAPIIALPALAPQPSEAREPVRSQSQSLPVDPDGTGGTRMGDTSSQVARVENARLALQLADALGDMNVVEFRVALAHGRAAAAASAEGEPTSREAALAQESLAAPRETADGIETPVPAASPPVTRIPPNGDRLTRLEATLSRTTIGTETPAPAARSAPAPAAIGVVEGTAPPSAGARSAVSPLPKGDRGERQTSPPTLPVSRQELPAPVSGGAPRGGARTEPQASGDERPSDSAASVSVSVPGVAERLTERGDAASGRVDGEARNLPHQASGREQPAGLADRVTLQVADADGRQTRIRVSVLGDQVRAVIVPPDAESARQLERRMDDLQAALTRQGFGSSKVSVQQVGESAIERGGAPAAALVSTGEGRGAASPGRDQPAGDQRQGRGQREQQHPGDGHRHPNGRSRDQGAEHRRR